MQNSLLVSVGRGGRIHLAAPNARGDARGHVATLSARMAQGFIADAVAGLRKGQSRCLRAGSFAVESCPDGCCSTGIYTINGERFELSIA